MTEIAVRRYVGSVTRRLAGWLARLHKQLSDHIFADGDAFAIEHGWEITKTAGWFGFGGRIYRDPRFDGRRPPMLAEQPSRGQKPASRGDVSKPWRPS